MRANLREIAEAASVDPKRALLDAAGNMVDYEVFHNLVLVAPYIAPDRTKGGIIRPDSNLAEDRFQGKAGLVLKVGPAAFKDDGGAKFYGITVSPGDWVLFRPSDGFECFISDRRTVGDGLPCRLIEDSLIRGRISNPALIY